MEKLAIISISAVDAELTLVRYTMGGYFEVEQQIKEPLNLVQDMDRDGYLKPSRIAETINLLKAFRAITEFHKIDNIICLADRTLSDARNQLAFFDEIYKTVSLFFKIIDTNEAVSTIHSAVLYSMSIPKAVIIDIQNSYINIVKYNRRAILETAYLPFGTQRLADSYLNIADPEEKTDKMASFVLDELKRIKWLSEIEPEYEVIGVGDAFSNAGKLIRKSTHYPLDVAHNYEISNKNFAQVYNLIRTLDLDKSKKLKGISAQRVDVLASGFAVIKAAFMHFITENVHVCDYGFVYGTIIKTLFAQAQDRPMVDVLGYSLSTISEFYSTSDNISDIYDVSVMLYRQLKVLHKLSKQYVKVLRIAASMCMSGKRISFTDYEKNCFNVINYSGILGATHKEIVLSAFVASSQNTDDFNMNDWVRFKDIIDEEDIDSVKKLGIIVKMAKNLCCTGQKNIKDISCDILGDTVILKTEVERNASLEISQAMSISGNFKKVFKKNLQIL